MTWRTLAAIDVKAVLEISQFAVGLLEVAQGGSACCYRVFQNAPDAADIGPAFVVGGEELVAVRAGEHLDALVDADLLERPAGPTVGVADEDLVEGARGDARSAVDQLVV